MSWKLWTSDRTFPILQPFDFVPNCNSEIHLILFIGALSAIVLAFLFPAQKAILVLLFTIEMSSCLLDQMRWQPWEYQYLLTLLFYIIYHKKPEHFLKLVSFLIICTYIFSGLHKFNGGFLYTIWDGSILRTFFGLPQSVINNSIVHYSGLLIPIIEISIGFGLLFFGNKKLFARLAIVMHIFILIILGPLGNNLNSIVWPWNVAMIALVYYLFYCNDILQIEFSFFKNLSNSFVLILIGVLPFCNFFGYWHNYLSFNLYSGNVKHLTVCITNNTRFSVLKNYSANKQINNYCGDFQTLELNNWALKELNVPMYPEESAFINFKDRFKLMYPAAANSFVIYYYPYKNKDKKELR